MRLVPVEEVSPDMKLAKPIYHKNGILLNTGIDNLHQYGHRLLKKGVNYVYVEDKFSQDIEVNDIIKEETRKKCKNIIKKTMEDISFNKNINVKSIKKGVNQIIDDIYNSKDVLYNLVDIKTYDSYTFSHSVNVAILSILIGKSLNFNRTNLQKLGIGSILHDIGKTLIPEDILAKKGELTEDEYKIIKKHPRFGYDYLKENDISPTAKNPILYHHERKDGSGYPKGITEDDMHDFTKIVAITDVFDALTSNRVYRKKWPTFKAINYLMSNTTDKFVLKMVKNFVRNLTIYPNGTQVKLSNGEKGIIKKQNPNYPTRPIVKIIENREGKETSREINLLNHLNIIINKVY